MFLRHTTSVENLRSIVRDRFLFTFLEQKLRGRSVSWQQSTPNVDLDLEDSIVHCAHMSGVFFDLESVIDTREEVTIVMPTSLLAERVDWFATTKEFGVIDEESDPILNFQQFRRARCFPNHEFVFNTCVDIRDAICIFMRDSNPEIEMECDAIGVPVIHSVADMMSMTMGKHIFSPWKGVPFGIPATTSWPNEQTENHARRVLQLHSEFFGIN